MALDRTGVKHPDAASMQQASTIDPRSAGQHWLKEWENARREALGKTQVVQQQAAEAGYAPEEMHPVNGRAASREFVEISARSVSREVDASQVSVSQRSIAAATAETRAAAQGLQRSLVGAPNTLRESIESFFAEELYAHRRAEGRVSGRQDWRAEHLHVENSEHGLSVWLRDSAIREEEIRDLIQRIERQLSKSGLKLYRFSVNGKSVFGGDGPSQQL